MSNGKRDDTRVRVYVGLREWQTGLIRATRDEMPLQKISNEHVGVDDGRGGGGGGDGQCSRQLCLEQPFHSDQDKNI